MNFLTAAPTLKISPKLITFNAACMKLLPDAAYVQFYHDFSNGVLFVKACGEDEMDKAPWRLNCSSREVRAKKVKWAKFYELIVKEMGWQAGSVYTIPAQPDTYKEEPVILFELGKAKSVDDILLEREFTRLAESNLLLEPGGVVVRVATADDAALIVQHDKHISADLLDQKIAREEVYVAYDDDAFVGWLRFSLFWDNTPFMNMLFLLPEHRGEGIGRQLTSFWEDQMKSQGYKTLMTSTQQNESAQHFYAHMGYTAVGGFALPGDTYELVMAKAIV